jgi:hypothetical protein
MLLEIFKTQHVSNELLAQNSIYLLQNMQPTYSLCSLILLTF